MTNISYFTSEEDSAWRFVEEVFGGHPLEKCEACALAGNCTSYDHYRHCGQPVTHYTRLARLMLGPEPLR